MVRQLTLLAFLSTGGLSIVACGSSAPPGIGSASFEAEVSGAVTGRVAGPGVVRFLAPSEAGFGSVPGHFFVADGTGVRDLGITFTIPADTEAGTYPLVSAHPMDGGTAFEVRVDRSVGNRTDAFESNTTGTIRLESFPRDGDDVAGRPIRGSFDFSTQDRDGREVTARGSFDFRGGERDDR